MDDLEKVRHLLELEYREELREFSENTDLNSIMRLVRKGDCLYPVRFGGARYNYLNRFEVEVMEVEPSEREENNFEYGKPVIFFSVDTQGKVKSLGVKAFVCNVEERTVKVAFSDSSSFARLEAFYGELGMRLYFDNISYQVMFDALKQVQHAEGRLLELRKILKGGVEPQSGPLPGIRLPWLNASQEKAVNKVLAAKDVAIVHGPPGTGKTTTLVEAVVEILHRETQVLVCAQSNTAVDWISEKLVERGVSVARIGNPARVNDTILPYTYERRFESHPDYAELWSIRKKLREQGDARIKGDARDRLKDRECEIEMRIRRDILSESKVVSCTLIGSASRVLEGMTFSTLFIDEAAQALEPASWVAISRCSRVVLAGDHWQLPPTVKCYEAEKGGLGDSLMMKVALAKPACVTLLDTQYRMHRDIMHFSSSWFYGGKVKSAPGVGENSILSFDSIVEWEDTSAPEFPENTYMETGYYNSREAGVTVRVLKDYINRIGLQRLREERIDFGIISPYKAQVYVLRRMIKSDPFLRKLRRHFTVHTVDGFQGQERDVVLISLVRANATGNIGFLRDLRRMNVAMTRARMKLIVIGSADTLSRHPFYSRLADYIKERGSFVTAPSID